MTLRLTCACGSYDRTLALQFGAISPPGITLDYIALPPEQTFLRQLRDKEFDVSEMSLSAYVTARAKGESDFLALPIFPSRIFRHSAIYVNSRAGIAKPQDLRGRRVGVGFYQMTAAVWVRGLLKDEYGLDAADVIWVNGPGTAARGPSASAVDQLSNLVAGTAHAKPPLEAMLEAGEIDALVSVHLPKAILSGAGTVRRLFEDYRQEEEAYFRRTGIFPIMHTLVLRRSVHEANPWAAKSLFAAFAAAKRQAEERLYDTNALAVTLPSLIPEIERCRALMGDDFWLYGIASNRRVLETFVRYLREQDIIARTVDPADLFIACDE